MQGTLKQIPLADIVPGKDNPRQINQKLESFTKLVDSIRAQGVIVPVHVRCLIPSKGSGKYELLAGERRYKPALKAGLPNIPAIDHGHISDEAAFEITFTDLDEGVPCHWVEEDLCSKCASMAQTGESKGAKGTDDKAGEEASGESKTA